MLNWFLEVEETFEDIISPLSSLIGKLENFITKHNTVIANSNDAIQQYQNRIVISELNISKANTTLANVKALLS